MADAAERELEGPRIFVHVPRSRPQRTRRMGRGSACAITSPPPAPRSRRKRADATTARHHRFPDLKEGESRGDPRRWADPREPDARHVVPRGLREPVSGGPASGRSDGAQADCRVEGETRCGPTKRLKFRRAPERTLARLSVARKKRRIVVPPFSGRSVSPAPLEKEPTRTMVRGFDGGPRSDTRVEQRGRLRWSRRTPLQLRLRRTNAGRAQPEPNQSPAFDEDPERKAPRCNRHV